MEAVQCYVVAAAGLARRAPRATLVDFRKVACLAGPPSTVEFTLPASAFSQTDSAGRKLHQRGRYEIVVGSASPGLRAVALGAPAPATAVVMLV